MWLKQFELIEKSIKMVNVDLFRWFYWTKLSLKPFINDRKRLILKTELNILELIETTEI